jgi:predicted rRNA methylase YqxC with S4 and FtsJ domains
MTYLDVLPFHWNPATVSNDDIVAAIRDWRNKELAASDYTQLPDVAVDKVAWISYRASLRAMLDNVSDPKTIVFPVRPNEETEISQSVGI